ncbi:MAG: DUF367 family protein [Thaumarchaeota archaeon]|nr:DUF367 family protein [Nitrososphaerota archaeon]
MIRSDLVSTPRVLTVELREDDPSKCTSAKMRKFRLARSIPTKAIPGDAIVLSPFASESILKTDRDAVQSRGLVVVDCSWVNAIDVFKTRLRGTMRRLPTLMAGNPTNYSKLNSLSSLEATAGALYITGFRSYATRLISLYKWGSTFLTLNENALNDYSEANSQEEMQNLEVDYFPRTRENVS